MSNVKSTLNGEPIFKDSNDNYYDSNGYGIYKYGSQIFNINGKYIGDDIGDDKTQINNQNSKKY